MEPNVVKRTKPPINTNVAMDLAVNSLMGRMALAGKMGMSHGGDRDLWKSLGYPENISVLDYRTRYRRQDIAKAIIQRPNKSTWTGNVLISEPNKSESTALEQAWEALLDREDLGLKSKLARLDRLTSLGRYGVLLLGLSDVTDPSKLAEPVAKSSSMKLLYVKPLGEDNARIISYVKDPSNARYGLPEVYGITVGKDAGATTELRVHHERVIHVAWDLLDDEVHGTPVLEAVFNRLMDLEKLVGGSGEMFWRGARPGFNAVVDKDYTLPPDADDDFKKQVQEYEHGLRRIFTTSGMTLNSLAPQVADPTNHVAVQIDMISAETGIPKRILLGSERGELSSAQDQDAWSMYVRARREELIEAVILRPLIGKLIQYSVLPKASTSAGYKIKWDDLFSISEKDRVEIGQKRTTALKDYASVPGASTIVPPAAFFEYFLGLSQDQITLLTKMVEDSESIPGADLTAEELEQIRAELSKSRDPAPAEGEGGAEEVVNDEP